jgi:hypothetical protein
VQVREKIARDSLTHADVKSALSSERIEMREATMGAFVVDHGNRRTVPVWFFAQ